MYFYTTILNPKIDDVLKDETHKVLVKKINKDRVRIRVMDSIKQLNDLKESIAILDSLIEKQFPNSQSINVFGSFYNSIIDNQIAKLNEPDKMMLDFRDRFPLDIVNAFPEIDHIKNHIAQLQSLAKDQVIELKDMLFDLQVFYYRQNGSIGTLDAGVFHNVSRMFDSDIENCSKRLIQLSTSGYYDKATNIEMSEEEEEVNGYKLYSIKMGNNIFDEDGFEVLLELWNDDNEMTKDVFISEFEEVACHDWSKMDRNGEPFGGFWKYPEGSYERDNACELSRKDNCNALFELPYPKKFVLKTVEIGCRTRLESVRYTNCLCEWMKRKIAKMQEFVQKKER